MGRYFVWALVVGFGIVLSATPAAAQVDIGVWTPNGGGRVVLGAPRVYYPEPVYVYQEPVYVYPEPVYVVRPRVYVERDYYYRPYYGRSVRGWDRGHGHKGGKFARAYYNPYPSRVYRSNVYRQSNGYGRPYSRDNYYRTADRGRRR
jgi:hypothetical protein